MKNQIILLLLMIGGAVYAQDSLNLGLCDSLPDGFYKKNLRVFHIEKDVKEPVYTSCTLNLFR